MDELERRASGSSAVLRAVPRPRKARVVVPGRTCTLEEGKTWRCVFLNLPPKQPSRSPTAPEPSSAAPKAAARSPGRFRAGRRRLHRRRDGTDSDGPETFKLALKAVAPPARDENFQIVGHFPGGASEADALKHIRDCRDSFGFNTLSYGTLTQSGKLWDESLDWSAQPTVLRRVRWTDAMAAAEGCNLWNDFDAPLVVLKTHGATKSYDPTVPCVHSPGYEEHVRQELTPALAHPGGARRVRLGRDRR